MTPLMITKDSASRIYTLRLHDLKPEDLRSVAATDRLFAETIARRVHQGQIEESTSDDYIHHVERVVAMVETDEAKTVAWLHDVIEDTHVTEEMLDALGFDGRILAAVSLLTRCPDDQTYDQYISEIKRSGNEMAMAVKIADLRDHLRPNCLPSLQARYERALAALTSKEADI